MNILQYHLNLSAPLSLRRRTRSRRSTLNERAAVGKTKRTSTMKCMRNKKRLTTTSTAPWLTWHRQKSSVCLALRIGSVYGTHVKISINTCCRINAADSLTHTHTRPPCLFHLWISRFAIANKRTSEIITTCYTSLSTLAPSPVPSIQHRLYRNVVFCSRVFAGVFCSWSVPGLFVVVWIIFNGINSVVNWVLHRLKLNCFANCCVCSRLFYN